MWNIMWIRHSPNSISAFRIPISAFNALCLLKKKGAPDFFKRAFLNFSGLPVIF